MAEKARWMVQALRIDLSVEIAGGQMRWTRPGHSQPDRGIDKWRGTWDYGGTVNSKGGCAGESTLPKERDQVITYWPCNTGADELGGRGWK